MDEKLPYKDSKIRKASKFFEAFLLMKVWLFME